MPARHGVRYAPQSSGILGGGGVTLDQLTTALAVSMDKIASDRMGLAGAKSSSTGQAATIFKHETSDSKHTRMIKNASYALSSGTFIWPPSYTPRMIERAIMNVSNSESLKYEISSGMTLEVGGDLSKKSEQEIDNLQNFELGMLWLLELMETLKMEESVIRDRRTFISWIHKNLRHLKPQHLMQSLRVFLAYHSGAESWVEAAQSNPFLFLPNEAAPSDEHVDSTTDSYHRGRGRGGGGRGRGSGGLGRGNGRRGRGRGSGPPLYPTGSASPAAGTPSYRILGVRDSRLAKDKICSFEKRGLTCRYDHSCPRGCGVSHTAKDCPKMP